jgi:hypothetical protein
MLVQQTITFGASATQLAASFTAATEILVEPLRANTAAMFVGDSALTQNGSAGVISDLAATGTGASDVLDRFTLSAKGVAHNYDASALYVWGTTGQGCKVTYWTP